MSLEEYATYHKALKTNWSGMHKINEVFAPMYGHKSVEEMSEKASIMNVFDKIKVPLFSL